MCYLSTLILKISPVFPPKKCLCTILCKFSHIFILHILPKLYSKVRLTCAIFTNYFFHILEIKITNIANKCQWIQIFKEFRCRSFDDLESQHGRKRLFFHIKIFKFFKCLKSIVKFTSIISYKNVSLYNLASQSNFLVFVFDFFYVSKAFFFHNLCCIACLHLY